MVLYVLVMCSFSICLAGVASELTGVNGYADHLLAQRRWSRGKHSITGDDKSLVGGLLVAATMSKVT